MALNTATIKSTITAARWSQKDDKARSLINGATSAELKSLDAEGVLRLYEVLRSGVYSADDVAAAKKLAADTQFQPVTKTPDYAVGLIRSARPTKTSIQSELTPGLVTRIYAAEKKRLSNLEWLGFDGATVGRGQLGQPAYEDVKSPKHFKAELEACLTRVFLARLLKNPHSPAGSQLFDMSTYKVRVPANYSNVWRTEPLEDFVVAAYLAIRIEAATKAGRSSKDAARFAVALYHGMRTMVVAAQTAAKNNDLWAPVEAELLKQGHTDEVAYVNEVVL